MALDTLLLKEVSAGDAVKLREYDDGTQRTRFMSLRDKIMQYPKIATGAAHPPVQESSCAAMKVVLDFEVRVRHALIHPSSLLDPAKPDVLREGVFWELSLEEVGNVCDAVLDLIQAIADAVGPAYGDVGSWLFRREASGVFPASVFE